MHWSSRGPGRIRTGPARVNLNRDIHRQVGGIHSPPLPARKRSPSLSKGPPVVEISLWHQCLRRLEAELPEQAFNTWIRPLQAVEDGDRLRLLAPNRYVVDWVNQNCTARISELVDELVPAPAPQVIVEIGSRRPAAPDTGPDDGGHRLSGPAHAPAGAG